MLGRSLEESERKLKMSCTVIRPRHRGSREQPYNQLIYIIKVAVCVCVFSIGGHLVGPTELKFGMEDHIYPGEVIV